MTILQASAIPFRHGDDGVELCLITSLRSGAWGFPKGNIDPGETAEQTALKEAYEEAGLNGAIVSASLGCYRYEKWGAVREVELFLMAVRQCGTRWSEMHARQRRWVSVDDIARFDVRRPPPLLLERALGLLAERGTAVY